MSESEDAGWIDGLPVGWIAASTCARRLFARLRERGETDPAPWHEVLNADYWGPYWGKSPEDYVLDAKLQARLIAMVQKAVASRQLTPTWFNGKHFKEIPASAFTSARIIRSALMDGRFDADPLWPDEWQEWNDQHWAIPEEQFDRWTNSEEAWSVAGLPCSNNAPPPCDPTHISSRTPSNAARVSLSEGVTWVSFGIALDAGRLDRAIQWESLAGGDLEAAQELLERAVTSLLTAGSDGQLPFYGRHVESYGQKGRLTRQIEPLELSDYRQFLIGQDHLYYGEGLKRTYTALNASNLHASQRRDLFESVTVDRAELMQRFPPFQDQQPESVRASGGRPAEHDWEAVRTFAKAALDKHPGLSRGKLADSLVAEYQAQVAQPGPRKRTIERKLEAWRLPPDKTVTS